MQPSETAMRLSATTLSAALIAAIAAAPAARAEAPDLTGHWTSAAPEAQGKIFVLRDFTFKDNSWGVVYRAFGDADAKQPLFTLDVGGVFVIGGPSVKVPGAFDGVFPALHRKIIAESPAGVGMFAQMGCVLELKVVKSLVAEGCGFMPPLMQAMGEYDLVAIKDGQFFFGERSGDLTKARPIALYPFPLVKR